MVQKRRNLTGRALSQSSSYSLQIDGGDISTRLKTLAPIYEKNKALALANLGQAGVNRASKILDRTGTPNGWGEARMAGEKNGVRFTPYGNSAGRNDTGKMIRSLSYDVKTESNGKSKARFGWIFDFEPYFRMQESGFTGFTAFAGVRNNRAVFGPSRRTYRVPGANSLPQALDLVNKIKQSFFAGAWNDSVREWRAMGRKTNPGSYMGARNRYEAYKNRGRA